MLTKPSAMQSFDAIAEKLAGKAPALFLDYDGTLTPIVERPEAAYLSQIVRQTLNALANACPVAVVSGRDRADLEKRVQLNSVYYAGSHGFDISGPGAGQIRNREGEQSLPDLREAERLLREALSGVAGALVEPKGFSCAVHYRLVSAADLPRVEAAVEKVEKAFPGLRKKGGKKVFEFLPDVEWDKGKAVTWLLGAFPAGGEEHFPIFLGDDLTDEDGFRVVQERGIGILVSEQPTETLASYCLQDVEEVRMFLGRLTELLGTRQGER